MSIFKISVNFMSKIVVKDLDLYKISMRNIFLISNNSSNNQSIAFTTFSTNTSRRHYSSALQRNNVMSSTMVSSGRSLSTCEITKNINLHTKDSRKIVKDLQTLRLKEPTNKPLAVIFSWLLGKQKHLMKFGQIYIENGFDVLTISITPWQLLWPAKGTQLVAADVVKFLENNSGCSPIVLHGFSVGAYLWGECMVHMARDLNRYKIILNRISGHIWDSAADITEIPIGVPKAVFPKNYTLQKYLSNYMHYHLKTFHEQATIHYLRSSQMFHTTLVKAPAIFFISKTDPVGAEQSNQRVRDSWESMGINCTWKCWDRSPHVGHYQKHKEDYVAYLMSYLQSINMIQYQEKIKAKL